jgi:hypothetical protein
VNIYGQKRPGATRLALVLIEKLEKYRQGLYLGFGK